MKNNFLNFSECLREAQTLCVLQKQEEVQCLNTCSVWRVSCVHVASLSKCNQALVMSRFESRVFVSCGHMCSLCRRFWGECESHSAPLIDSPVISGSFISKTMPSHLKQWKHLPPVQRFSIMLVWVCRRLLLRGLSSTQTSSSRLQKLLFGPARHFLWRHWNIVFQSASHISWAGGTRFWHWWQKHLRAPFFNFSSFKAYEEVRCRRHEGIRCCLCRVTAVKAFVSSWTLSFPKWSQISFNAQTQPENESWQRDLSDEAAKDVIFR